MKKGFTLVELLAVIILLGIVAIIVIPTITNSANSIKESNLKTTKNMLETTMLKYAGQYYIDEIKPDGNLCTLDECCAYFSIRFIKAENIFQSNNDSIINPVTGKDLEGYIKVSYDTSKYDLVAEYKENDNDIDYCTKYDVEE